MIDDPRVAVIVEAMAIGCHEYRRRRSPLAISLGWYDLDPEDQAVMLAEAHAALRAALAAVPGMVLTEDVGEIDADAAKPFNK